MQHQKEQIHRYPPHRNALQARFLHRQLQNQNIVLEERVKVRTELLAESVNVLQRTQEQMRLQRQIGSQVAT